MAPSRIQQGLQLCRHYISGTYNRYLRLNILGKSFVWFSILVHIFFLVIFLYYGPARIFQFLYDLSQKLKAMRYGWLILLSTMVVISFPPLIGYSTCVSLCGFAYDLEGFYIAGPATLIGSGLAFLVLRLVFKEKLKTWTSKNEKWQALEQVIAAKGLPLIILIRISPFPPYVYSQALFASISVVKFSQFMFATVFYQYRILLAVFIGSRIAKFSDGNQRGQMDTSTKILNAGSIIGGILIGLGVGWFLYQTVQEKIKSTRELPPQIDELAAEALEEADEGAPLLLNRSSDSMVSAEAGDLHHSDGPLSGPQSPRTKHVSGAL